MKPSLFIPPLVIIGICLFIIVIRETQRQPQQDLYKYNMETHDLETWRKRGLDMATNKNTKSILKRANNEQLLAMLYLFYNWDLVKCEQFTKWKGQRTWWASSVYPLSVIIGRYTESRTAKGNRQHSPIITRKTNKRHLMN